MSGLLADSFILLQPLERASAAVGRLAQAAAGTPVLAAWLHRSRAEAAASIADIQGRRVDPNRLRTLLARVPARASRDWGATMLALDLMRQMLATDTDCRFLLRFFIEKFERQIFLIAQRKRVLAP